MENGYELGVVVMVVVCISALVLLLRGVAKMD